MHSYVCRLSTEAQHTVACRFKPNNGNNNNNYNNKNNNNSSTNRKMSLFLFSLSLNYKTKKKKTTSCKKRTMTTTTARTITTSTTAQQQGITTITETDYAVVVCQVHKCRNVKASVFHCRRKSKRAFPERSLWLVEGKKPSVVRLKLRSESNRRECVAGTRFKFHVPRVQLERLCDNWLQKRHGRNRMRETWNVKRIFASS